MRTLALSLAASATLLCFGMNAFARGAPPADAKKDEKKKDEKKKEGPGQPAPSDPAKK